MARCWRDERCLEDAVSRIVPLAPVTGLLGFGPHPTSGETVPVRLKMFLEIWEPGDPPIKRTLADLKRNFAWDQSTGALRIKHGNTEAFTIGPEILAGLPDTTPMRVGVVFGPGLRPETIPSKP